MVMPWAQKADWVGSDMSAATQLRWAAPHTATGPRLEPELFNILWDSRVKLLVKPRRYEHVLRVASLSRDIALANGIDAQRAYAAGILHDIARDLPNSELLRLAPPESEIDTLHPLALHGRAGRTLLTQWGYRDEAVLDAVEDHTTGPRSSSGVAACVYVADVSEPGRGVNADIRELALQDLDAALARAISSKVHYLQGRGIHVHPRTMQAYEALRARGVLQSPLSVQAQYITPDSLAKKSNVGPKQ